MSDTMSENSIVSDPERPTFTIWDDIRWGLGCRTNRLGNYVCKLGDRIHGDGPMGLEEAYKLGHAMGKRKPGEVIDLGEVLAKAATA
jgi:hypothetical protein